MRIAWQLDLPFDTPTPATAEAFLAKLRQLGLNPTYRCRLTRNRTVVVSYRGADIRVHRDFTRAPEPVLRAIVSFVQGRTRAGRVAARRVLLAFPLDRSDAPPPRSPERTHPADDRLVEKLRAQHARFNADRFGGMLQPLPIRVSRRMRSKLGCYTLASPHAPAEIVISRRHIRRHSWEEVLQTLLHEMVHQWQAESGCVVDHGRGFRAKAREVGCAPSAKRAVA
jgi:hypothetical protein